MHSPVVNEAKGSYRSFFFDLKEFLVQGLEFRSQFFTDGSPEAEIPTGKSSFYYLREEKLRIISVFLANNKRLRFEDFAKHFAIGIKSNNLFKTGKYLSRVFRPVKYGGFYQGLSVNTSSVSGKIVDGISLISHKLAVSLGWKDVAPGMSAQFTLFYSQGLVKGHCVVSDIIDHDIVIYGEDNIKQQVTFNNGTQFVTLEPVKLSPHLRMDIQSLLNLWGLFGSEQYLMWAYQGVEKFKEDLFAGKVDLWLDNFADVDIEDIQKEQWTLRKAIWHKIDYTKYPGLIRAAWTMFRNSMLTFTTGKEGNPAFHIPVPGGKRGYIRVDLRNHDKDGNFKSNVERGVVELDKFGNLWIHDQDIEKFMAIKGGADQDDGCAIIPVKNSKAVIYRNPNQYGEYGIYPVVFNEVEITETCNVIGNVPIKDVTVKHKPKAQNQQSSVNALFERVVPHFLAQADLQYNKLNLIRAFCNLRLNTASIGLAANAEMLKTGVGIENNKDKKRFLNRFIWNLENIIDAAVKEGFGAQEDMAAVNGFFECLSQEQIAVPSSLLNRIPERLRIGVKVRRNHPLDELLCALRMLIDRADIDVLGRGSASRGNRIPGMIDFIDVPLTELGLLAINDPLNDLAINLLKGYNREIAILLESTKDKPDSEVQRLQGIERIQAEFLMRLQRFDSQTRAAFTSIWAYEIYKTASSVHDSILWLGDKGNQKGTADDTILMLCSLKLGMTIKSNGTLTRNYDYYMPTKTVRSVRVWHIEPLDAKDFCDADTILIEQGTALLKDRILKLGEETIISDGIYTVTNIAQSVSKKDSRKLLKNSLAIYLS